MVSSSDLQENLTTAGRLIDAAAKDGARVIALPEYFCIMGLKDTDKVDIREPFGIGPIQDQLANFAKDNSIYLIAGTIPLEMQEPGKVLNSILAFNPDGQQIGCYDKIHLFGFQTKTERYQESETIEAGNHPSVLKIFHDNCGWTFGLSLCYDLRLPELYRAMGIVDCHIIPAAFTYTTGKAHWEILLRARAIENQCYVLSSAQGGSQKSTPYLGAEPPS